MFWGWEEGNKQCKKKNPSWSGGVNITPKFLLRPPVVLIKKMLICSMSNYTCHFHGPHSRLTQSLSLCEVTWLCFQINFKLICVFSVWHVSFTWQFKITQGNTQPSLRHNPAGQRPHRPFPSSFPQGLLLNSQPSLKAKLKSFLLQELPLDSSPVRPNPSTPAVYSLSTFYLCYFSTYLPGSVFH